jgi:flavin reductase (DIM6/NTAB) family NADH-FMN oxidoreductase RutF
VSAAGVDGPTEQAFSQLTQHLDAPMFIVTAAAGRVRSGCLVGFASQVSIHPGRFLACISVKNHTYRVARKAESLGVHVVPDSEQELAELFGGETGDETDKFARCAWHPAVGGTPLLDACPDRFVGRVLERIDLGDHSGFLLEPVMAEYTGRAGQLSMRRAIGIEPGHEP